MQRQNKTASPTIPNSIKKAIYTLFLDNDFTKDITDIIRVFLLTTWKMKPEDASQLMENLLLAPITNLVSDNIKFKCKKNDLSPIIKKIILPFILNENNHNDLLYESIIRKWWDITSSQIKMKGSLSKYLKNNELKNIIPINTLEYTLNGVKLLLNNTNQYEKTEHHTLCKNLLDSKKKFFNDVTGEFDGSFKYIHVSPVKTFTLFMILFTLPTILFMNFSVEMLILISFSSAIASLLFSKFTNSKTYKSFMRNYSIEAAELTNYFISDKILESVNRLATALENKDSTHKVNDEVLNKIINKKKPTLSHQDHTNNNDDCSSKCDTFEYFNSKVTKIRKKNKRAMSEKIKTLIGTDIHLAIRAPEQLPKERITWHVKMDPQEETIYTYDSDAVGCKVAHLNSTNLAFVEFCKNNYVAHDENLLQRLFGKKYSVLITEFSGLLRNAHVVPAKGNQGIVLTKEGELKAKTLKDGYSHYRVFCKKASETQIKEIIDGKGKKEYVTKSLYIPYKITNKS